MPGREKPPPHPFTHGLSSLSIPYDGCVVMHDITVITYTSANSLELEPFSFRRLVLVVVALSSNWQSNNFTFVTETDEMQTLPPSVFACLLLQ